MLQAQSLKLVDLIYITVYPSDLKNGLASCISI